MANLIVTIEEQTIIPESVLLEKLQKTNTGNEQFYLDIINDIKEGIYMIKRKYVEDHPEPILEIVTPRTTVYIENIG